MPTHLLGATVQLHDLVRLRAECGPWRHRARRTATTAGAQRTSRRGRGLEIEEIRAYQPSDDARDIDWRVTARKGRAHTKVYREEREQPVLFALDLRPPMAFGSRDRFKSVAVAELFALQAWAALADEDRVGAVIASAGGILSIAPQRGEAAVLRLLAQVAQVASTTAEAQRSSAADSATGARTAGASTALPSIDMLLTALARNLRAGHRSVVISDFHDITEATSQRLQQLGRLGDSQCTLVFDRMEEALPPPGSYTLLGADGHTRLTLNSADAGIRARYAERMAARRMQLAALARYPRMRVDELCVDEPATKVLRRSDAPPPAHTAAAAPADRLRG